MARLRQNEEKDTMKDFVAEINAQCGRYGYKTQASLAKVLDVCQPTVGNYLRSPETIPLGTLRKIVKQLKLDPVVLLRMLGYSTKQIQSIGVKAACYEQDDKLPA